MRGRGLLTSSTVALTAPSLVVMTYLRLGQSGSSSSESSDANGIKDAIVAAALRSL